MNTFIFGGLYKRKINLLGLGDFLQIFRVVVTAVLITALILNFTPFLSVTTKLHVLMMLDFYFLISLVAGSRILFHTLNYRFKRELAGGKKMLIYGADWKGMIAVQALLQSKKTKKIPVGFLDDDPELEGKYINGYPIFGGLWKLERLVRKRIIDEIILTEEQNDPESFRRIKEVTEKYNVPLHISRLDFKSLNNIYSGDKRSNVKIKKNRNFTPQVA
jgi:FlaA1/EpsC-like NDP-sugar epimerase